MGESAKAVLVLLLIVFSIAAAISWNDSGWPIALDLALSVGALGSLGLLLYAMLRADKAPDFLKRLSSHYFERDGFTFAIIPTVQNGVCQMAVCFQNRYSNACEAQVYIKPSQEFFMTRRPIQHLSIGVACEGGGFGVAFVPWGIPKKFQSKKQNIDVGASVRWPNGKGELLRFRDGHPVNGPKLESHQIAFTVAAAMAGIVVFYKPVRQKIRLPANVEENVPEESPISITTLWRPGDPIEMEITATQ